MRLTQKSRDEEYVETSDPEEMEAVLSHQVSPQAFRRSRSYTPQKRLKLHHDVSASSPTASVVFRSEPDAHEEDLPIQSLGIHDLRASSEFSSRSSADISIPTPSSPLDDEYDVHIAQEDDNHDYDNDDFDGLSQFIPDFCLHQQEPDGPVDLSDILGEHASSQDPLDVIPAVATVPSAPLQHYSPRSPLSRSLPSPSVKRALHHISASSPRMVRTSVSSTVDATSPSRETVQVHLEPSPLFQLRTRHSPARTPDKPQQITITRSPQRTFSRHSTGSSPLTPPSPRRFSSTPPPNSSIRLSAATDQSPRLDMPFAGPSDLRRSVERHPSSLLAVTSELPEEYDVPFEATTRRYSLRTRQARQLNPYEYDKREYRRLLRGNPDAIVKVTSPTKRAIEELGVNYSRQQHYQETQDDVWEAGSDADEDSQTQVPRRAKRVGDRQSTEMEDSTTGVQKWYPKAFDLSDDELPPLPPLPNGPNNRGSEPDQAKRKQGRRKRFPLPAPTVTIRPQRAHSWHENGSNRQHQPVERSQPIPASPSSRVAEQIAARNSALVPNHGIRSLSASHSEPPEETSDDTSAPLFNLGENDWPDVALDMDTNDFPLNPPSPDLASNEVVSIPSSPIECMEVTTNDQESSQSISEDDLSSESSEDMPEADRDKKRRKAMKTLGRMMPAVMISKVLGNRPSTTRPAQHQDTSEDEESVLQPGKSKTKKAPIVRQHPERIEGDSESSDESENRRDSDTVNIISSEEDDQQDDGIDDEAIEAEWFDRDYNHQYHSTQWARKEESLIDRMLSRTTRNTGKKSTSKRNSSFRRASGQAGAPRPKNPALDIIIGRPGSKTDRQTRLSFPAASDNSSGDHRPTSGHRRLTSHTDMIDLMDSITDEPSAFKKKKNSKKQKRDEVIRQQTYLVPSNGKMVVGQRRRLVSVNVRDEGFHRALAPLSLNANAGNSIAHTRRGLNRSTSAASGAESWRNRSGISSTRHASDLAHDIGPLYEEDDCAIMQNSNALQSWKEENRTKAIAKLTPDFDISPLPSGLVFGPNTNLGRQLLHDLLTSISGESQMIPPNAYSDFGLDFSSSDMSAAKFAEIYPRVSDILCDWVHDTTARDSVDELRRHDNLMQCVAHFSAWLVLAIDDDTRTAALTIVSEFLDELRRRNAVDTTSPSEIQASDVRLLSIQWFIVDISSRIASSLTGSDKEATMKFLYHDVLQLMRGLLAYGLQCSLKPILAGTDELQDLTPAVRTAEMWIGLIHMAPRLATMLGSGVDNSNPFWGMVLKLFLEDRPNYPSDFEASEHVWEMIFSFSALSQFSVHGMSTTTPRLTACWDLVTTALKVIRLTSEPLIDGSLSYASLRKRDEYVRMVTTRCFLLSYKWKWRLNDAYAMLSQLVEIFKSRKFASLRGEDSDFPGFLRHSNLGLLMESRNTDSAFTLFLKLIVQAVQNDTQALEPERSVPGLRKLLSLAVPLSSVPFSKAKPPMGQELSMLYNRLSSVIIAIYLEPTEDNMKNRLRQARRYVVFKDADWKSKQACIRALMHIAILTRHLGLSLEEPLKWLEEMTAILLDEYNDMEEPIKRNGTFSRGATFTRDDRNRNVLSIQLLLGSVRKIIETPTMDPTLVETSATFPDPALLEGQWVTRVFGMKDLTSVVTTSLEIQKLVQSFLDVRAKAMPAPRRPALLPMHTTKVEESQDEFDDFDLDFDDPELIAALETGAGSAVVDENKAKDQRVAKIMDEHISTAIYRFVIKHFSDPSVDRPPQGRIEEYCRDADRWVDCWVGCAAVIVQNGRRNWSHYLSLGPQSWERISDSTWRRRVGLRFMFSVLHSDPAAYTTYQDSFLHLLLESMVTSKVTIENEYASLLFSIDGLRHPMLRGIHIPRESDSDDFRISRIEFVNLRVSVLDGIFGNIAAEVFQGQSSSVYLTQKWIEFVLSMLSSMREAMESALVHGDTTYIEFCKEVFELLSRHPPLQSQSRLHDHITWGAGVGSDIGNSGFA